MFGTFSSSEISKTTPLEVVASKYADLRPRFILMVLSLEWFGSST